MVFWEFIKFEFCCSWALDGLMCFSFMLEPLGGEAKLALHGEVSGKSCERL